MSNEYPQTHFGIPTLGTGERVYHYTSAEGLKGIMEGEFWATERHFLNDRSEFTVGTQTTLDVIEQHLENSAACERLCDALTAETNRLERFGELDDKVAFSGDYVISLCLDKDSPLLWSEFSDFQGYCLELDCDALIEAFKNTPFMFHGKVVYNQNERMVLVEQAFENEFFKSEHYPHLTDWKSLETLDDEQLEEFIGFLSVICECFNMFFKRECFAGECEYRIVISCIHDGGRAKEKDLTPVHFRASRGVLMPYIEAHFEPTSCVLSAMVGPKNTMDIAEEGLRYFFRNQKIDVEITRSEIPLRY